MGKRAANRLDTTVPSPAAQAPPPASDDTLPRGFNADPRTEQLLSTWKAANAREVLAEIDNKLARDNVAAVYAEHHVDFIVSSFGTIPITHRKGGLKTNWQAIARARIPAAELEALIALHSEVVAPSDVLSAPNGWSAEAKASR